MPRIHTVVAPRACWEARRVCETAALGPAATASPPGVPASPPAQPSPPASGQPPIPLSARPGWRGLGWRLRGLSGGPAGPITARSPRTDQLIAPSEEGSVTPPRSRPSLGSCLSLGRVGVVCAPTLDWLQPGLNALFVLGCLVSCASPSPSTLSMAATASSSRPGNH